MTGRMNWPLVESVAAFRELFEAEAKREHELALAKSLRETIEAIGHEPKARALVAIADANSYCAPPSRPGDTSGLSTSSTLAE